MKRPVLYKKRYILTVLFILFFAFPSIAFSLETLSVTKAGTGTGTVTSSPAGIDCGATCSAQFDTSTVVTLTAVSSSGSTFTGWSGEGCIGIGQCVVTMDAAKNVTATFNLPTNKSGAISTNTDWTLANSPYYVTGDITISSGVTLTIDPGVIVKFAAGTAIDVSNGTLSAQGSAGNEIYFTDYRDDSVGGDTNGDEGGTSPEVGGWNAIFTTTAWGTITLDHCVIKYSGNAGSGNGSVRKTGSGTLTVTNSTISYSGTYGIFLSSSSTAPHLLSNITVTNTGNAGIYLINAGNGTVSGNNTITNTTGYGIYLSGSLYPAMSGTYNFGSNSSGYMGYTPNASFAAVNYDSLFPGLPVYVATGTITVSRTWSSSRVYYLKGNVTVNSGVTLNIDLGVKIKFAAGKYLNVSGTLNAQGTAGNPIYFTDYRNDSVGGDSNGDGGATSPAAGGWSDIYSATAGSAITLNYCVITYGGSGGGSVRMSEAGNLTLSNSTVSNSGTAGVYVTSPSAVVDISGNTITGNTDAGISLAGAGSGVNISRNTITNNNTGVYCSGDSDPVIGGSAANGNDIYGNASFGVRNDSPGVTVNATYNYWGDPTGPYHATTNPSGLGDTVSDYVYYGNYLAASFQCIPATEICDNIDNDCDGYIDEDLTRPTNCEVGACASAGIETCTAGIWGGDTCIDENLTRGTTCGVGACFATGTTETCSAGVWSGGTCTPGTPASNDATCDGLDDDCDGQADEDYVPTPTSCGIGVCASTGQLTCSGGVQVNTCVRGTPGTEGPWQEPPSASCTDGLDNDCDGVTDASDGGCMNITPETYRFERFFPALQQPWYFRTPYDVAVDAEGFVYIVERDSERVQKLTDDGQVVTTWGSQGYDAGQFSLPRSVAVDNEGFVYVLEMSGYPRVQKFSSDGKWKLMWGSSGSGSGQLNYPEGIAVDNKGFVYVADTNNHRISKWTTDGDFVGMFGSLGSGINQFNSPRGIDVDNNGYLYVADTNNHRISKWTTDGDFVGTFGSLGSGINQFNSPGGIDVDNNGYLYVADTYNHRISKWTTDGLPEGTWNTGGGYTYPTGISLDNKGYIYVTFGPYPPNRIEKYTIAGQLITKWKSYGTSDGQFYNPLGIAVDSSSHVFVADMSNRRVQVFNANGGYSYKWGSSGSGNGNFGSVKDITIGSDGLVYVTDSYLNRVQKFTTAGIYQSQWGSSGTGNGQFNGPDGITADSSGFIYVADNGNNRIQKFDQNGNFVTKWGSQCNLYSGAGCNANAPGALETGDGQFNTVYGVAADNHGFVYVADFNNNRIQKFTAAGEFVMKWGSVSKCSISTGSGCVDPDGGGPLEIGDGQFYSISDVAVDSNGFVYCVDPNNNRIQKFTPDGRFITKFGGFGNTPETFNNPTGIALADDGKVYVSDNIMNAVKVFKRVALSSNNKAIVVAGGGPYAGNKLWEATQTAANFAYWTLMYQGFPRNSIYYLTANDTLDLDSDGTPDRDGDATIANLQNAIETWASDADNVFVYLVDHGGSGTFRMNETETLPASGPDSLDEWLDSIQCNGEGCITGNVTVIYDACESGSFLSTLTPPDGKQRIRVTSTSIGESSYFVNQGSVSFSNFFWTNVFNGSNVKEAFDDATSALTTAISNQTPQLEDNGIPGNQDDGDGLPELGEDGYLAKDVNIGNGTIIYGNAPTIESVSASTPTESSATLTATNVTDADGIARVWAVILPPNYTQGASNNAVNGLPYIDLMPVPSTNNYTATYDQFNIAGTYNIAVYARDSIGSTSMPSTTTVTISNPLRRRAIIVAGEGQGDVWDGIEKGALAAYNALKFQGYSDADIYFVSPIGLTGSDGAPSLQYLEDEITSMTGSNTHDLVLYMVGNGDTGTFDISSTETLPADNDPSNDDLDTWLDALQDRIAGTVTVVYDASRSGSFISDLLPASGKKRIVVTSTDSNNPVSFLSEGSISFSRYFWGWILNGLNVRDAYLYAKSTMSQYQTAQIEDSGNGVANESGDGVVAFSNTLGSGIRLAGNAPLVGSVPAQQTLNDGGTSATIYAEDVTTTGTLSRVWAVITPPYYDTGTSDIPLTGLPEQELSSVGGDRYEGTYSGFTEYGTYKVAIYASDTDGNVSTVEETSVKQLNAPDIYEDDDAYGSASVIVLNNDTPQTHNFHDSGDADWVMFYGLNGQIYQFEASSVGASSDVVIELYRSDGTTLVWSLNDGGTGTGETKWWDCDSDEIYYVKVYDYANNYGLNTGYDLDVYRPYMELDATIAGYVKDPAGNAIQGAIVSTSTGESDISKVNGYYFIRTEQGTKTVTASKSGYTPDARSVVAVSGNTRSPDPPLVLIPQTYTISGYVKGTSSGLDGVAMTPSGTPAGASCSATDGGGSYSCSVSPGWSGTITPSKTDYTFNPSSKTYSSVNSNRTNENYTPRVEITGTLNNISGVSVSGTNGANCSVNGSTSYTCTVDYNWSGTVTPSKSGYTFSPTSRNYNNVTSKQTSQNYTGAQLISYYCDGDGDTYKSQTITGTCSGTGCQPAGCITTPGSDCNDSNASIKPGAAEVCDSVDNDCDGLVDDADPGVTGQQTWYQDSDGDGYGTSTVSQGRCVQPAGFVSNSTDCDDSNANAYPNGPPVRIAGTSNYYWTLQGAYDDASDTMTLESKNWVFNADLYIDLPKNITIKGGYNCAFTSSTGSATVNGNMTISDGTMTISEGKIQVGQ